MVDSTCEPKTTKGVSHMCGCGQNCLGGGVEAGGCMKRIFKQALRLVDRRRRSMPAYPGTHRRDCGSSCGRRGLHPEKRCEGREGGGA